MPAAKPPYISFLAFFLLWAERMRWDVPLLHIRVCHWLEHCGELALLMLPRGHAKSTILGVYNAWRYYLDPTYRILHQGDQDSTSYKTSRDTKAVLQRHPLTCNLPLRGEVSFWWVDGNDDERNPSMQAAGILSNITSSRADEIQNDDVEVPKNIATPEAREKLRYRLGEQTHILVPGGRTLYVGTPHTHDSLYEDIKRLGADALVVKMFEQEHRIEKADKARYSLAFMPEYVFEGIGEGARLLRDGVDYRMDGLTMVLADPAGALVDCYAGAAWPERFDAAELAKRRIKTRTINEWDSQYQLHAKPVTKVRLDPDRMVPYDAELVIREANNAVSMWLGQARVVAASLRWDPSGGKLRSDVSAAGLVLQDEHGRRYAHHLAALTGEVAEFDDVSGKRITGGQVWQLCDIIERWQLPRITIETNGIGGFAPAVMKAALKQRRLLCGVSESNSTANKNRRILDVMEPLLLSRGMIWAHVDVLDGPLWDQMKDWNPKIIDQDDDYIDVLAAACNDVPERVGKLVKNSTPMARQDWRTDAGVYEVTTDF